MSNAKGRENKVILFSVILFYNEQSMSRGLEILRKHGFGQDFISKNILLKSSLLRTEKTFARFLSATNILDYSKVKSMVKRFKKAEKEIIQKHKIDAKVFLGYVSFYHSVLLQNSASLYSLYFEEEMYQKIELSRMGLKWIAQEDCHEIFHDSKALTFCDDLYRILRGENL